MWCSSCFSFLLLFFLINPVISEQYSWDKCKNSSTYGEGSTYAANLNRVMLDLFTNTSVNSGFNTSSFGQTPNKVYGLLQCFANISADTCSECAQEARTIVMERCNSDIGGMVLKDYCFLRYDNTDFFSSLDTTVITTLKSPALVGSKYMAEFKAKTSTLLSDLSNLSNRSQLFAIGSAKYDSNSPSVYGFVQCWRDLSINDCKKCLFRARTAVEDCCSQNQGARALLGSCVVRFESNLIFDTSNETSPYSTPKTNSSPPPVAAQFQSKKKHSKLSIILGVVGAFILLLLICPIAMSKRARSLILGSPVTRGRHGGNSDYSGLLVDEHHLITSLESLIEATKNFHEKNKLGEGGFGAVYRGTTREGKEIAVKKLSVRSTQGKKEFKNEVQLMAKVQHRNLVKLLGCCADGDERLIVYEYVPNGSLDTFLFHGEKRKLLDWEKRYNIIIGIARGLLYLHEDSKMKIIHRDIKANNILLDDKLNPKIADFGLARLFPEDETHIQTKVAGTCGYMAPEYAMGGQLSVKSDIYSFGVLLLEILSGRKNTDLNLSHEMQNLLEWAWRLYRGGDVMSMVEKGVRESCPEDEVVRCIHVALLCVQADATLRPTMSNVIMMISSNAVALPNPTQPAYITCSDSCKGVGLERRENGKFMEMSGSTSSSTLWVPSLNEPSVIDDMGPR